MQQREKAIAGILVTVIVGYGGFTLVKKAVIEPRRNLQERIADENKLRDELEVRLNGAEAIIAGWQGWTKQTLDTDPFVAHQAFREDVDLLLDRNKLTQDLTTNKGAVYSDRKGPQEGFAVLPLTVKVKGELDNLVNFLKDLYQRPYPVRVEKLNLRAELARRPSGSKSKGPTPPPKLNITMTLNTLVLPAIEDVEHPTIDLAALNDPGGQPVLASAARLQQEDLAAYNEIANPNPFQIYEPPPPPPPVVREPREVKEPVERNPVVRTPPDPRRDAHKFVVTGTGCLDDGPIAYVINTDKDAEPPDGYRLNDEVDDGKLVLVVPQGIVVRVTPESRARTAEAKNYFYTLGGTFKDREEVTAADHPEVARLLRQVLKQ